MKHRNLFRLILTLIAAIEVALVPIRDFELGDVNNVNTGHRTIWQNVGIRSFYGPWNIAAKQNGDYVDYNDYGVHVAHFRPNSLELPYDDVSITNGYIDELPSVYDSNLPEFNTLLSSVGLADFRIGVRTGDWIDRNTDGTTERYWEDIASQKTDEDTEEPEDSAIPNAARQSRCRRHRRLHQRRQRRQMKLDIQCQLARDSLGDSFADQMVCEVSANLSATGVPPYV